MAKIIVIGDDYLAVNGKSITTDFDAIANFTVGDCEAKMGFDDGKGNTLIVTGGDVTDNGDGTWKASIDITKTQTGTLSPGNYDWSIEIVDGGTEYTVAMSLIPQDKLKVVAKQT